MIFISFLHRATSIYKFFQTRRDIVINYWDTLLQDSDNHERIINVGNSSDSNNLRTILNCIGRIQKYHTTKSKNSEILTYYCGFEIDENGTWNVFSSAGLAEEGVEGVVSASDALVWWHLTVGLDSMFQAVQLPAGITDLNSGLSDMDRDAFTLKKPNR